MRYSTWDTPELKLTTASPYQATVYSPRPHPYCITLILLPIQTIPAYLVIGKEHELTAREKRNKKEKTSKKKKKSSQTDWDTLPEIKATFATISEPLISVGKNKRIRWKLWFLDWVKLKILRCRKTPTKIVTCHCTDLLLQPHPPYTLIHFTPCRGRPRHRQCPATTR